MCAIYGYWQSPSLPQEEMTALITRMGMLQHHRGPDDAGVYYDAATGLGLGHRRLSIIDLSPAGHQPMLSGDGQIVLTFNGEIYNYLELRAELESLGHSFRSRSDTETIIVGYQQWGEGLWPRLAGIFVLALWDTRQRILYLLRDPTGVKPLLYSHSSQHLAFASEAKGLAELPGMKLAIDPEAMATYVEFGYLYDGHRSMFTGVVKVPPGHVVKCRWQGSSLSVSEPERWWQYPQAELDRPLSETQLDSMAEELHHTLQKVLASQLQSDVPVGLLLSGGLDSSLLAAYASKVTPQPLKTVCMGFDPAPLDERPFARQVAEFLQTDHREMIFRPDDIVRELETNIRFYDDLFWDTGFLSSLAIYRSCRELGLKVMLVGEGSDEVFGGYAHFQSALQHRWWPASLFCYQQYRLRSSQQWGPGMAQVMGLHQQYLQEARGDRFQALRRYELEHQIPNSLNMKVDRSSMASSIEARVPFQDPRLLQLTLRWPTSAFVHGDVHKRVLRRVAERYDLLPKEIVHRPKFGMMLPGQWMEGSSRFRDLARDSILQQGGLADYFDLRPAMERFFAGHDDTHWRHFRQHLAYNTLAWRLAILALWKKAWES
ncbi:MAG: asparagine synthase (glutamine-hydrolyzing) [Gemmatales bacterium]